MVNTMNYLMEKTEARIGYTQSDEITLIYYKMNSYQNTLCGGRLLKLASVLSSIATAKFNQEIVENIPEKSSELAFFDCRVWNVPSTKDVLDLLIWRQEDAIKNAISMTAHEVFGDKKLHKKNSNDKLNMLKEAGYNWEDYPEYFKSGTYAMRKAVRSPMPEELKNLKSNVNNKTFLRNYIDNFHLERLKMMNEDERYDTIFLPVYLNYMENIKERNDRKKHEKPTKETS
jgi:tRNA(His) 5'-end guanylyltransferase